MRYKLLHGDCLIKMKEMDDNSVDAIITDPPYGLSFMGKKWDYEVPSVEVWREALRVLKPGGYLLSFAGSRTYHRLVVNVEDAGFEIRDQIMWVYGSGFPKSHNISKAIDKAAGAEREIVGERITGTIGRPTSDGTKPSSTNPNHGVGRQVIAITSPATPEAKQWDGWGSALKPAHEPIVVARKPLIGTIVENVLEHGTGGLNIDACRIAHDDPMIIRKDFESNTGDIFTRAKGNEAGPSANGRYPANFIHDGSDEVVSLFPTSKSTKTPISDGRSEYNNQVYGGGLGLHNPANSYNDSGSAARFFYCAKPSQQEKHFGVEELNIHPTVKPVDLMKYLCRLITPPNGIVLDPFMGSGTTGIAATQEGFNFIGIEMNDEYIEIANQRISHWVEEKQELIIEQRKQKSLFDGW